MLEKLAALDDDGLTKEDKYKMIVACFKII